MKKILVFINHWDEQYSRDFFDGIKEGLDGDTVVHFYNIYDEAKRSIFFEKELEIVDLPDISQYDGIIAAPNTSIITDIIKEKIVDHLEEGYPFVLLDQHIDGVYHMGIDNYLSFYNLVEHMIKVHGCKTFNYVGGEKCHVENIQREKAFKDCLKNNGLEMDERRIKDYHFLVSDGRDAYHEFKNEGLLDADAIMCANDYMAMGYIEEAERDGVCAPRDYMIAGFDNLEIGQNYLPSITSINKNTKEVAKNAIKYIYDIIEDPNIEKERRIPGLIVANESCGCEDGKRDYKETIKAFLRDRTKNNEFSSMASYARMQICASSNFDQLMEALDVSFDIMNLRPGAICLNSNFFETSSQADKIGFTENTKLFYKNIRRDNGKGVIVPEIDDWADEVLFWISSIHYERNTYGYYVMPYDVNGNYHYSHRTFLEMIGIGLAGIEKRLFLDNINASLNKLYVTDALTGMLNRFGLATRSSSFYEQNDGKIYIIYMDLDNLKIINDKYGHATGDIAIQGAAYALKETFEENDIIVRMGGDEFLVMGAYVSEEDIKSKILNIEKELAEYSKEKQLPVPLEASTGYVFQAGGGSSENLEGMINEADSLMYDNKQRKKQMRKNNV